MKNLIITFCAMLMLAFTVQAQSEKPAASPASTLMQKVGQTDITVVYSRPGVKDRTIFAEDGLLPYGQVWRTGANAANKFTFSTPVTVNGTELEAGDYTVTTVPGKGKWTVNFYKYDGGNSGAYAEKKADASFMVEPASLGDIMVETFFIDINNISDTSAVIGLVWENTYVGFPIEVPKTW